MVVVETGVWGEKVAEREVAMVAVAMAVAMAVVGMGGVTAVEATVEVKGEAMAAVAMEVGQNLLVVWVDCLAGAEPVVAVRVVAVRGVGKAEAAA